ncbi:MAG TPA: response regulator transcription factor [Kofleriaceae bacterium]|nr:response regulator transcription factor [Kofleriaceae bacterium]
MDRQHDASAAQEAILIVEDDAAIATGLALNLRIEGYSPTVVSDGDQVAAAVAEEQPVLILLDLSLPRMDGLQVLGELRRIGDRTPVIVLSAREDEYDKVAALRLGADDYVTKPFALAELMARVAAVLRRSRAAPHSPLEAPPAPPPPPAPPTSALQFGDVAVDLATRTVTRGGADVRLTHLEFELLAYLIHNPAQVLSRERLLREVWGVRGGSPRTVDNFVAQLRGKLEDDPDNPTHIVTVRGSGYRWAHR